MRFLTMPVAAGAIALCLTAGQVSAADIYAGQTERSFKDTPYNPPATKFYFAVRGGATFPEDTDFDINVDLGAFGLGTTDNIENQYDDVGFIVSGAIGMSLDDLTGISGLRTELEVGYFENEIDAHTVNFDDGTSATIGGGDAFGETSAIFGLLNLYYDFTQFGRIKPFIGGGVGIASVELEDQAVNLGGTKVLALDDEDTGFAYQLSAGANVTITDSVDLELGYRYLGINGVELEAVDGTSSDVDVDNHIIYGGLRFKM